MLKNVTIVDYGIGNLLSVGRALESCGATVTYASDAQSVMDSGKLVLPGVGAFVKGMQGLQERGLIQPLLAYAKTGRPLLGICLGMQMLFTRSSEFGNHEGLGLIDGDVTLLQPGGGETERWKVPHIGWSPLQPVSGGADWKNSIFDGLPEDAHAYFVHSFSANPKMEMHRLADTHYGNARISAAVRKENIYGCQFHPEKSAKTGLHILKNFVNLTSA